METVENFSLDDLNPVSFIKKSLNTLLYFLLKVVIFGVIILVIMNRTGLMDDQTVKTYILYFVVGSILMYLVTAAYLWYQCRTNKTIDYKKIAKTATLAPAVILAHVVLLIICSFISVAPEIGGLIYLFSWTSFGVVLVSGTMYTLALDVAERTTYC